MPGWMKHKLESRLLGRNINNLRYADDTTIMAESEEELKSLFQHHSSKASILYDPALTSVHDYWKNHSFDYMDLCLQSDVSAF